MRAKPECDQDGSSLGQGQAIFPGAADWAQWREAGNDTGSLWLDPGFRNPSSGDYRLAPEAKCPENILDFYSVLMYVLDNSAALAVDSIGSLPVTASTASRAATAARQVVSAVEALEGAPDASGAAAASAVAVAPMR